MDKLSSFQKDRDCHDCFKSLLLNSVKTDVFSEGPSVVENA